MTVVVAAQSVVDEQNRLAQVVSGYSSTMEIDLARANVLEIIRISPATTHAIWQMMLSALRSRRAQLEFRSGNAPQLCVETDHVAFPGCVSSQEPPAADISR